MVVAATVTTAMLNLFVDVQNKLQKEFRNYGANVIVIARDGQSLPSDALAKTDSALTDQDGATPLAVPFAYAIARTASGQPVVVSGTDLIAARQLNSWWSVTAWPTQSDQALVGIRAASQLSPQGKPFDLTFQERTIHIIPVGTVQTGAAEDSRIYLPLASFESWTGIQPSTIEISIPGPPETISAAIQTLRDTLPTADVRPVRQITETEARVLGKTRATLLSSSILIIITAALCVLATLTGWVLDRRRDFAIMKALGASQRFIGGFFAAEAALLGAVGALLGFALGIGIAAWIGRANFHAPVMPRFEVFPIVFIGCILVALASAILPISLLRRVQPAMILKGE
jgi:putative ABC transport system permease protein